MSQCEQNERSGSFGRLLVLFLLLFLWDIGEELQVAIVKQRQLDEQAVLVEALRERRDVRHAVQRRGHRALGAHAFLQVVASRLLARQIMLPTGRVHYSVHETLCILNLKFWERVEYTVNLLFKYMYSIPVLYNGQYTAG